MSVKVSSWVWHESGEVNGNELILLLALADVADDFGRCRFVEDDSALTYDTLAGKVRVDRRTIERLIPKLRERGLVEQIKGVKGRPNEFSIVVPWAPRNTDNLSGNELDSPTATTEFPDKLDTRTSLKRIDVSSAAQKAKKGSRISADWKPSPLLLTWGESKAPSVNLETETENFVDYWLARAGAGGVKLDWDATWRTWMRNSHQRAVERGWKPAAELTYEPGQEWMLSR